MLGQPTYPVFVEDGWHRYHLDVNQLWGNRLMVSNDVPLRANNIVIAAPHVRWWHKRSPLALVQHPLGNHSVRPLIVCDDCGHCYRDSTWSFRNSPSYALVLKQFGRPVHSIFSQDIDRPDQIPLAPNRDIYINVNQKRSLKLYSEQSGRVEIMVKIID